ncbi:MAG: hypothetical protein U5K38_00940 [Woeseiaceae bacterium]|nr:hypothetical protein [Woeseiaceae bacterium]
MARKRNVRHLDEPQRHPDHRRPITRRDFVAQGFLGGSAFALGGGILSLFSNPRQAYAQLSGDLQPLLNNPCDIATEGAGKIPFICFDLAGGANIAGSNVLVGKEGGQLDFLGTAGYERLGLPGDMVPGLNDPLTGLPYANQDLGLAFHSDSAFKRGMERSMSPARAMNLNGAIIPSRSENDTGNNPLNPLYGIARAGADGSILTLAGTENTDSGGNSMVPSALMDPELRPTKVDRPSDVTALVDTGQLVGILGPDDATAVMESIYRISDSKMSVADAGQTVSADAVIKDMVRCGYLKAADIAERFGDTPLNPAEDPLIVGPSGIFSEAEFNANGRDGSEFRKTASVMKLVMNGFAGAACIEMGGYDYHGGRRAEGEVKDERAGRCMGACIEYAARIGVPLMLYVFSDGSLSSNGAIDNSIEGRGKGEWVSDNSSTAAGFFMVYNPYGRATLRGGTPDIQARHQQIGYFDSGGSVQRASTPAANNPNLLVNAVVLNYMALHGDEGQFGTLFPNHGLGDSSLRDSMTAFEQIVSGTINPLLPA